jgi:putative nucleotidyltransferase with HDIG domain
MLSALGIRVRHSIFLTFFFTFIGGLVIVFLAIYFFVIKDFENVLASQFKRKSASQVQLLALKLERDLKTYNYSEIDSTFRALFDTDPDVIEVSVYEYTPATKLLSKKRRRELPFCRESFLKEPCIYKVVRKIDSSIPIFLEVSFSTESLFYGFHRMEVHLFYAEAVSFLVLLFTFLGGYFILKRRTLQVVNLLEEAKKGKIERIPVSYDEFGFIEDKILEVYRELYKEKEIDDKLLKVTSNLLDLLVKVDSEEEFIKALNRELKKVLGVEVELLKRPVVRLEECLFSVNLLNNKEIVLCIKDRKLPDEMIGILVNIVDAVYTAFRERFEKENLFLQTISALANTIDASSPWTRGHSLRVSEIAVEIGKAMGLKEEELEDLRIAGILHDIGKIGIPKEILDKRGKLTDEEYEIMKKHSLLGYEVLKPVKLLKGVLPAVLYHHERCDGSGYPEGLKCHEIPLLAKIIAVADVIEAMTAERPYKSSYSLEDVLSYLEENKGKLFDSQVVDAALKVKEKIEELLKRTIM